MNMLFHKGYFSEMFRQLKVAGIVSTIIMVLVNFGSFVSLLINTSFSILGTGVSIPDATMLAYPMMIYIYIAGLVLTFTAYNWLNHRAYSDFYHGLPIKRSQIYFSSFLAIVLWMFIALTAHVLVLTLIYAVFGAPFNYLLMLCVYINMLIGAIEVVGAVSIACAISGTRFVNLIASVVILFLPRFMLTVLGSFVNSLAPDFFYFGKLSILFDPSYNMIATPYALILGYFIPSLDISFSNVWAMLYSLVYSLLLVFIGGVAFVRRRSETAGMPTTSRLFQILIRTAIALPLLLLLVYLIFIGEFNIVLAVLLILFSFIGYCLYELISTRSGKKALKAMPLYVIPVAIAILYFAIPHAIKKAELSRSVSESNIKGYSEVASKQISLFGMNETTYRDAVMPGIEFTDPESVRIIANAYERSVRELANDESSGVIDLAVRIDRKIGKDIIRKILLTSDEYERLTGLRKENEDYLKASTMFPSGRKFYSVTDLGNKESKELAELYEQEFNSLTPAQQEDLLAMQSYFEYFSDESSAALYVYGCVGTRNYVNSYPLDSSMPNTYRRYLEIVNSRNGEKAMKELDKLISWTENGGSAPSSNVYFNTGEGTYVISSWDFYYGGTGEDTGKPMDNAPNLYDALKIISKAEVSSDPNSVRLIRIGEYKVGLALSDEDLMNLSRLMISYYQSGY